MNGILVVDKPAGFTSFDVIAKLRGMLGERRLGHGGTLDPMATGVLPVFAGAATKAVDLLPNGRKRYVATVRLGVKTDTGDVTGAVVAQDDRRADLSVLQRAADSFRGAGEQIPPMVSAVRVDGKRLYELARAGKTVERAPRPIEIYSIAVSALDEAAGTFTLDVECSKGTYIRTLAEDVAAKCGCLASLAALRRTMSAGYGIDRAYTLTHIEQARADGTLDSLFLPVDSAFEAYGARTLDENLARLFLNGFAFEGSRVPDPPAEGEMVRIYRDTIFLGLGRIEDGKFKKVKQFWFEQSA